MYNSIVDIITPETGHLPNGPFKVGRFREVLLYNPVGDIVTPYTDHLPNGPFNVFLVLLYNSGVDIVTPYTDHLPNGPFKVGPMVDRFREVLLHIPWKRIGY